jgi:flavorubredoxin
MAFQITKKVEYVGKIDWTLRKFHGEQLSTFKGSSYNSYLIRDKKNVLIDGVWGPFAKEFVDNLEKIIGIQNIDYVIALHAEPDHSQALENILAIKPDLPIYCTANGIKSLKGYFHKDWNFIPVKTGDKLNIGEANFVFLEAAMLHWPDQMMAYLDTDKILFSSDAFGQHFASEFMFDDKVEQSDLMYEAMKYYANIVAPYSKKVTQKLEEVQKLNLPLEIIAPAHGIMWKNPNLILQKYAEWADNYKENQITIVFDTMYESTRKMAEAIAAGIRKADKNVAVKIFNSSKSDNSDIIAETFRSKAILVGSPTYNNGILNSAAAFLEELKGLRLSGKKAASFCSYGWVPAAAKVISNMLSEAGFELFEPNNITANWNPTEESLANCSEFGSKFAEFCK